MDNNICVIKIKGFFCIVYWQPALRDHAPIAIEVSPNVARVFADWELAYGPCTEDEAVDYVEDVTGSRPVKVTGEEL